MEVIQRAFWDALSFFGISAEKIASTGILWGVTFLLLFWELDRGRAVEEVSLMVLAGKAVLVSIGLVFLWNLWLAPYRLAKEHFDRTVEDIHRTNQGTSDDEEQQDVIRMMRTVMAHFKKNILLDPDYDESRSRASILCDKLTEKGLAPAAEHAGEFDGGWPDYLSVILPYVEEYGVAEAQQATRKLWETKR